MSKLVDTFTVKQERGQDSTVQVFEEWHKSWPCDKRAFRFVSDQSLASNSDRAWKVEKAIENYAKPLGFDTNRNKPEKNEWLVYYDENFHSHMNEFKLRTEIQNHPTYQAKSQEALERRDAINREYGVAIRQLKNLVSALEARNQKELDNISQELIATQLQILNSLEIPEVLGEQDRKFLFEPNYPITRVEMDHYDNYGQGYFAQDNGKLPDNLNSIMTLLD